MMATIVPYKVRGNKASDQAEPSTLNPRGGTCEVRVLVELQLISYLLAMSLGEAVDLAQLRQDIADSIT